MGLGIGANTAIFSVVHSVLLQPLPYDDGEELVWFMNRYLPDGDLGAISGGEFWEYRRNQPVLQGLTAVSTLTASLTGLPTPVQLRGLSVSPGYFSLLGTGPVLGRAFLEDEEQPGRAVVTVISHGLDGAVAMGRLLQSFLYGVSQTDAATLAVVLVTVLAVTGFASFGPARRAAMLPLLTTLREK
jgi:hypothetical protein